MTRLDISCVSATGECRTRRTPESRTSPPQNRQKPAMTMMKIVLKLIFSFKGNRGQTVGKLSLVAATQQDLLLSSVAQPLGVEVVQTVDGQDLLDRGLEIVLQP